MKANKPMSSQDSNKAVIEDGGFTQNKYRYFIATNLLETNALQNLSHTPCIFDDQQQCKARKSAIIFQLMTS